MTEMRSDSIFQSELIAAVQPRGSQSQVFETNGHGIQRGSKSGGVQITRVVSRDQTARSDDHDSVEDSDELNSDLSITPGSDGLSTGNDYNADVFISDDAKRYITVSGSGRNSLPCTLVEDCNKPEAQSRFRVVKVDSHVPATKKKGRWTCKSFHDYNTADRGDDTTPSNSSSGCQLNGDSDDKHRNAFIYFDTANNLAGVSHHKASTLSQPCPIGNLQSADIVLSCGISENMSQASLAKAVLSAVHEFQESGRQSDQSSISSPGRQTPKQMLVEKDSDTPSSYSATSSYTPSMQNGHVTSHRTDVNNRNDHNGTASPVSVTDEHDKPANTGRRPSAELKIKVQAANQYASKHQVNGGEIGHWDTVNGSSSYVNSNVSSHNSVTHASVQHPASMSSVTERPIMNGVHSFSPAIDNTASSSASTLQSSTIGRESLQQRKALPPASVIPAGLSGTLLAQSGVSLKARAEQADQSMRRYVENFSLDVAAVRNNRTIVPPGLGDLATKNIVAFTSSKTEDGEAGKSSALMQWPINASSAIAVSSGEEAGSEDAVAVVTQPVGDISVLRCALCCISTGIYRVNF